MDRIITAFAAFAAALLTPASAASAQERVVSPPLEGFYTAHDQTVGDQSIREEIPEGETLENWTRMATTISLGSYRDWSAIDFAAMWVDQARASCPDANVFDPSAIDHNGREAALFGLMCPQSPTNGGYELFMAIVIKGDEAMHMKQFAFRYRQQREESASAVEYLQATRLCDADCLAD
ncbi:hypothetical protein [Paraurantiacibacter namhicola]|uniref:Uncharacterized protein n=1 Tax=Paraurantiacibacter namhicola TaxID=645517 RepID=A0A1C7D9P9_9SPHN|nr:hypothetical protein [Paraurantiacibacter namhicola]ANU08210.1 hypothetical protein A6F65_01917 [Paraurantiacibacter namhicola]